jgi:hypothetical protein
MNIIKKICCFILIYKRFTGWIFAHNLWLWGKFWGIIIRLIVFGWLFSFSMMKHHHFCSLNGLIFNNWVFLFLHWFVINRSLLIWHSLFLIGMLLFIQVFYALIVAGFTFFPPFGWWLWLQMIIPMIFPLFLLLDNSFILTH